MIKSIEAVTTKHPCIGEKSFLYLVIIIFTYRTSNTYQKNIPQYGELRMLTVQHQCCCSPSFRKENGSLNKNLTIANRSRVSEGIYRPKYYTVTLKSRLRVIQGHWKQNHWKDHTWLSSIRVIWREIYRDLEMWVRGHSMLLKMVSFESLGTVPYSPSIVTRAISLAISETFSIKTWPDLEIWVWSHSRSLKMARFNRPCMTFY